jgi:heat-inducible transcriptional repressor
VDERKRLILNAIIQDYIYSAEPVGSRTLVKRHRIGLSPATIRNEMADLEEMGYLQQPHTSAGRIPSPRGYRFYVNTIMEDYVPSPGELKKIGELIAAAGLTLPQSPRQMAKFLAAVTNYISLIAGPADNLQEIRHINLVPYSISSVICVIVLSDGAVKHHAIGIPEGVNPGEIEALARFLQKNLQGLKLNEITPRILAGLKADFTGSQRLVEEISLLVKHLALVHAQDLVMDGTANLLKEPEFRDIQKVREVFETLEQGEQILRLLVADPGPMDGLGVRIGPEIGLDSFADCSLVVATFLLADRQVTLGVLGPARMQYAKTIGLIRWLQEYFSSGGY